MKEEFIIAHGVTTDDEINQWANQFVYNYGEDGADHEIEILPDDPDYEPLAILLYFSGDAEIFMNFSDDEPIDCPYFP